MNRLTGFVGKKRYEVANSLLPQTIKNWASDWCFMDAQAEPVIEVRVIDASSHEKGCFEAVPYRFGSPDHRIQISYSDAEIWRNMVFGHSAGRLPNDGIAEQLLLTAQQALINGLLAALKQSEIRDVVFAGTDPLTVYGSCLIFRITINQSVIECLVHADLLNGWLPCPETRNKLTPREEAIGAVKVRLRVELPLAKIPVGYALDLNEQDVMRSDALLTQPFRLLTDKGDHLCHGYLAKTHTNLALQLRD